MYINSKTLNSRGSITSSTSLPDSLNLPNMKGIRGMNLMLKSMQKKNNVLLWDGFSRIRLMSTDRLLDAKERGEEDAYFRKLDQELVKAIPISDDDKLRLQLDQILGNFFNLVGIQLMLCSSSEGHSLPDEKKLLILNWKKEKE